LIVLSYLGFSYTSFQLLRCVTIQGVNRLWLAADDIICYRWWQVIVAVAVLALLFPLPVFIAIWQWWVRKKERFTPGVVAALVVLEWPYRPTRRWWECVRLFRRFVMVGIYALITDPYLRSLGLCVTCALVLVSHMHFRPFNEELAYFAETVSLFLLFALSLVNIRTGALATAGVSGLMGDVQTHTAAGMDYVILVCTFIPIIYSALILLYSVWRFLLYSRYTAPVASKIRAALKPTCLKRAKRRSLRNSATIQT